MRRALVFAAVIGAGCAHGGWSTPPAPPPIAVGHDPDPPPRTETYRPRSALARLTPNVVLGAVLGQSYDQLASGRPMITRDPERYDFREHYVETVNLDGVTDVHYYTLPNAGVMYQISLDFTDADAAERMWAPYASMGTPADDLGGHEVILAGYPFEIRVWQGDDRVQFMAVIEGSEWWDQYHPTTTGP